MALQIDNTSVDLGNGLSVDQFYVRIQVEIQQAGTQLNIRAETYYSKDFYKEGKRLGVPYKFPRRIDYNRETDGSDVLEIAHNEIKNFLINQGISESNISVVDVTFS